MKRLIQSVQKFFAPVLILCCFALCLLILAVVPGNKAGILFAILCASLAMAGLRWSVWGILRQARKKATDTEFTILVRVTEVLMVLLTVTALVFTLLLWEIPTLWIFFPIPLFGLEGALAAEVQG